MTIQTLVRSGAVGRVLYAPPIVYSAPFVIDDALIASRGSNVFEGNW